MKKKRFYYVVVSFMKKEEENVKITSFINFATVGEKNDDSVKSFFPILQLIKNVRNYFKDICVPETILVENMFEISESDYKGIQKLYKLPSTYYNGKKED